MYVYIRPSSIKKPTQKYKLFVLHVTKNVHSGILIKYFFFFLNSIAPHCSKRELFDGLKIRTHQFGESFYIPGPARVLTNEGTFNILMKSPQEVSKHKNPRDGRNTRGTA